MMDYLDFELEIERVGKGKKYRARVRKAPVDFGTRCWCDLPAAAVLEELSLSFESLQRNSRNLMPDAPQQAVSARDRGRRLFELIFAGPVLEAWRASVATARNESCVPARNKLAGFIANTTSPAAFCHGTPL